MDETNDELYAEAVMEAADQLEEVVLATGCETYQEYKTYVQNQWDDLQSANC